MRAAITAFVLLVCLALAAGDAQARKMAGDAASDPAPADASAGVAGLRGSLASSSPLKPTAKTKVLAAATPRLGGQVASAGFSPIPSTPDDAQSCRQACAHKYYFCLAGEISDSCPGAWSRCLAGCAPDPSAPSGGLAPSP